MKDERFALVLTKGFSTLQCGSWIDAIPARQNSAQLSSVSVPFNAGRGLMQLARVVRELTARGFSTLQCGSWIDAPAERLTQKFHLVVSVPFNAGRGLMPWAGSSSS